jgi:hypothetical protein
MDCSIMSPCVFDFDEDGDADDVDVHIFSENFGRSL